MEHEAFHAVGTAGTEARGRSSVRPFHGRAVPAWHEVPAMAAGEGTARLHHGAGEARK